MMNSEASQIDRIVREVMRRLEQGPAGHTVSSPVAESPVAESLRDSDSNDRATDEDTLVSLGETDLRQTDLRQTDLRQTDLQTDLRKPIASDATTLCVTDRVVTADLLGGRLNGVRRIQVRGDAVVTPLVRDLLNEKNVELQRVTNRQDAASRRWLLVEHGHGSGSLLTHLRNVDAQWRSAGSWQQLVDAVMAGDSAIVVTSTWATRVCQANRNETVRAVQVFDATSVQQAMNQANVNLLIVNADQVDETAILEIAQKFVG